MKVWRWPGEGYLLKTRRGLEIRAAASVDAAGLSELFAMAGYVIAAGTLADRLDAIRQQPGATLIATAWGPPSGLIVSHWYRSLHVDQPIAEVTTLLVGPDERRLGIGRRLLKAAAQAARVAGCDTLEILAPPHQQDLRELCRATGFVETGTRFARGLRKKL
jgi:aminoglycoside 6'-N-acetyltransferase I